MDAAEQILLEGMQRDIAAIREKLDRLAETNGGGGMLRHLIAGILGALAGFGGSHAPLPWGH